MERGARRGTVLWVRIGLLVVAGGGLLYLATYGFTYYDNGQWIQSNLLAVYTRSLTGYGARAIEDRRLPPDWGSRAGYVARNFMLDLAGLDYSLPLDWEDIAAGPGLSVVFPATEGDRVPTALYPSPGILIGPGEKLEVTVSLMESGIDSGSPSPVHGYTPAYSATLYRPRFSSVAYVVGLEEIKTMAQESRTMNSDDGTPFFGTQLDFALGLFQKSFREDGAKRNILVSPYSVTEAFAMACAGANGDTRETMAGVLGFESSVPDEIMQSRRSLHGYLESTGPDFTVLVANSIWMTDRAGVSFLPEFVKTCHDVFGAETRAVDFSDPKTANLINDWVNRKTKGKVPSIVDKTPADQIAALVNAVYMKAAWEYQFNPKATGKAPFHLSAQETAECDMMVRGAHLKYLDGDSFQAVFLPYAISQPKQGKAATGPSLGMYLLLPDQGVSLSGLVDGLMSTGWRSWMKEFKPVQAVVHLPRFKVEYAKELDQALTNLGMGIAFSPAEADFSAMCQAPPGTPVYIGSVNHRTYISVDEEGTEAAAATYIAVVGSAPPEETVDIVFDRPFLYAVSDSRDPDLVLFLGCVIRP